MKKSYYIFLLFCLYGIIFVDILFLGRMVDIVTIVVICLMYPISRKVKKLDKIYFYSAIGCLLFALMLYLVPIPNKLYDVAANWLYVFLFAGTFTMLIEEIKK